MLAAFLIPALVLILSLATSTGMFHRRGLPRPRPVIPRLPVVSNEPQAGGASDSGGAAAAAAAAEPDDGVYRPTAMDVLVTKAMLQKALRLPAELVDTIVDHAEYWPHTTSVTDFQNLPNGDVRVLGGRPDQENRFLLRSRPLGFVKPLPYEVDQHPPVPVEPRRLAREYPVEQFQQWVGSPVPPTKHPCRRIVFTFHSHDQGWGGQHDHQGTYQGSYTWFEAGLERFDMAETCDASCPDHKASEAHEPEAPGPEAAETAASASTTPSSEEGPPTPASAGSADSGGAGMPAARTSFQKKRDEAQQQQPVPPPVPRICSLRPVIPPLAPEPDAGGRLQLDHSLHPSPAVLIQRNVTAARPMRAHRVEWSWTDAVHPESPEADELARLGRGRATGSGEFVRDLKLGDVVTVWAMARFYGWVNLVQKAQVDVYWAL